MIILLSPAKTFNKETLSSNKRLIFEEKHNHLLNILKSMNKDELKSKLKLTDSLLNNVISYYNSFNNNIKAISLYGGHAFKHLKYEELNSYNNLYILSALYGLVNANDAISKYRLDLDNKILDDKTLIDYWYNDINNYLTSLKDELIINLSSNEYSRLLDLKMDNLYTINFQILKNGKLTSSSMELKKMRGKFANCLINNNINDIKELKTLVVDGYKFDFLGSKDNYLNFVKVIE